MSEKAESWSHEHEPAFLLAAATPAQPSRSGCSVAPMTSPTARWAILDGRRVRDDGATIHASDLGLRRGFAVFEAFRVEECVPLFLEDHLARLARSADAVGLPLPRGAEDVAADVHALLDANAPDVTAVHILLTGGPSDDGVTFQQPTCIVTTMDVPLRPGAPTGARLVTHRHTRELPEAKSTNYLTLMRLAAAMREAGAIDVLYHDGVHATECARSALAVILGDTLVTRRESVLQSVSMTHLLGLARERMHVEERAITLEELHTADEVLTSGSVRGIVPIVALDGHPIGDGTVGPHARGLFTAFAAHVAAYVATRRDGTPMGTGSPSPTGR
jgi:branched-chain amino acid aminotransferase